MIGKELSTFLQQGIAIQIGTRNARLEPGGTRVVAVKVEDDGSHVVAYVPKVAAQYVIPDLEANGQAALVFARPPDERACQVKGVFVGLRAARTAERPFVSAQWERWVDRLARLGLRARRRTPGQRGHAWPSGCASPLSSTRLPPLAPAPRCHNHPALQRR